MNGRATAVTSEGLLVGHTDLLTAAGLLGGQAQLSFGIPFDSRTRVPASFHVNGDRLTGWSVDVDDILVAADNAGYLKGAKKRQARAAWPPNQSSNLVVEYVNVGQRWVYRPPPARSTIEMSADESFETAMRSCTGVGQSGA